MGRVHGGSFLMVEVDPGRHRVSSPAGQHERFVLLEAAADSAYFFELEKELWAWSWRANIKLTDPEAARDRIRRAHMVSGIQPGRRPEH